LKRPGATLSFVPYSGVLKAALRRSKAGDDHHLSGRSTQKSRKLRRSDNAGRKLQPIKRLSHPDRQGLRFPAPHVQLVQDELAFSTHMKEGLRHATTLRC
jgi:ribosomal protein L35